MIVITSACIVWGQHMNVTSAEKDLTLNKLEAINVFATMVGSTLKMADTHAIRVTSSVPHALDQIITLVLDVLTLLIKNSWELVASPKILKTIERNVRLILSKHSLLLLFLVLRNVEMDLIKELMLVMMEILIQVTGVTSNAKPSTGMSV